MARTRGRAEVDVIGAGAVNQAIKAVAIARGYLAGEGLDLVCWPAFTEVSVDGELRTAIRLVVEARRVRDDVTVAIDLGAADPAPASP